MYDFTLKKINIEGENNEIHFPSSNWNDTVKEGDLVDLTFRVMISFSKPELYGVMIDDYE